MPDAVVGRHRPHQDAVTLLRGDPSRRHRRQRPIRPGRRAIAVGVLLAGAIVSAACGSLRSGSSTDLRFVDATSDSGLTHTYGVSDESLVEMASMAGGLAAVDFDRDGDVDILLVAGDRDRNRLFRNDGSGVFTDVSTAVGLDAVQVGSGPLFFDMDGDRDDDLFIGGVDGSSSILYEQVDGTFTDVTASSGLVISRAVQSTSAADVDGDGDLDLFLTHWGAEEAGDTENLWTNDGSGRFRSASTESGVAEAIASEPVISYDYSFTVLWTDVDGDRDPDALVAGDFGTSFLLRNQGGGVFTSERDRQVLDECCGMGASVADFDLDGDMDWFVTSVYRDDFAEATEVDREGNRLYLNDGSGGFSDGTPPVLQRGGWGWGSCAEDFDNDGLIDLFHVNGWAGAQGKAEGDFTEDPARLFHSSAPLAFDEVSRAAGIDDRGQGRAVACVDIDDDGDIDIVRTNTDDDAIRLYRNESPVGNHLKVELGWRDGNDRAIGARVQVESPDGPVQHRDIRAGDGYLVQGPAIAHFGLGPATTVDVVVLWPDGETTTVEDVAANTTLHVTP